jgi:hypothetical protein
MSPYCTVAVRVADGDKPLFYSTLCDAGGEWSAVPTRGSSFMVAYEWWSARRQPRPRRPPVPTPTQTAAPRNTASKAPTPTPLPLTAGPEPTMAQPLAVHPLSEGGPCDRGTVVVAR